MILENIRSTRNVGHILRTACVGAVDTVCLVGLTSDAQSRKVLRGSLGAEQCVNVISAETIQDALQRVRERHPKVLVVCVETTEKSMESGEYFKSFDAQNGIALVFGNERSGVSMQALSLGDVHVHLPLRGEKASLNVADCASVVLSQVHHVLRRGGGGAEAPFGSVVHKSVHLPHPTLREYPQELSSRPINEHSDAFTVWAVRGRLEHPIPYG